MIADVDPATGRAADTSKMYVVCGAIRRMGESDDCIVRLTKKDGILTKWVLKLYAHKFISEGHFSKYQSLAAVIIIQWNVNMNTQLMIKAATTLYSQH